jgi:alcohol dehydrogenase class IV
VGRRRPTSRTRTSRYIGRLFEELADEDGIPALVEGAMGDGTTLLNPREMSEEDYAELYRAAL